MTDLFEANLDLCNARIVLQDRIIERGTISIRQGSIAAVLSAESLKPPANDIPKLLLDQLTVFPGFIDIHLHGAVGVDVMEASAADLKSVSEFLATKGITSWLPTMVPTADEKYVRTAATIGQAMKQTEWHGARILGLHYEGPFVNAAQCGALHRDYFKTYSGVADLDRLATPEDIGAVKMITLAPEVAGGIELVEELHKRGWVISIGHTRADVKILEQSFAAGARHMTHFMNAMAPLHHRNPGPIAWGLSRDEVTVDFIADGIHLDPFMLRLLFKLKGSQGLTLISDAIAAAGEGDGEYRIWGETITVRNGRTSNSAGSIAGSVITVLDAVRMMRSLGATAVELAKMASLNPARLLSLDSTIGSIEVGKRADLVALDDGGSVRLTIVAGRVVYQA